MNEHPKQAFFTLGEAAKAAGKSKATISNAVKKGRLSVHEKTESGFKIAAAELFRAFPAERVNSSVNVQNEQTLTGELNTPNRGLEREIELLRERLAEKDETIQDLRERLDRESEERRNLTAMLTDQRQKEGRGFWSRLFGN
jgi:hypothetical protein